MSDKFREYFDETVVSSSNLEEAVGRKPVLKGVILHIANAINKNKRRYNKKLLQEAVERWKRTVQEDSSYKVVFLDHLISFFGPSVNKFDYVAGVVIPESVTFKGNKVVGDISLLETRAGKTLQELLHNDISIGVSARQIGEQEWNEKEKYYDIKEIEILGWDFVFYPATPGAFAGLDKMVWEKVDYIKSICCGKDFCELIENQNNPGGDKMEKELQKKEEELNILRKEYEKKIAELQGKLEAKEKEELQTKVKELEAELAKKEKELEEMKDSLTEKVTIDNNEISNKDWSKVDKTALRNKLKEAGSAKAIKECFALVPDIEKQSTWGWPHHEARGSAKDLHLILNRNGVIAAYKALVGARGGGAKLSLSEKKDIAKHLVRHYRSHLKETPPEKLVRLAEAQVIAFDFGTEEPVPEQVFVADVLDYIQHYGFGIVKENVLDEKKCKRLVEEIMGLLVDESVVEEVEGVVRYKNILDNLMASIKERVDVEGDVSYEKLTDILDKIFEEIQKIKEELVQKDVEIRKAKIIGTFSGKIPEDVLKERISEAEDLDQLEKELGLEVKKKEVVEQLKDLVPEDVIEKILSKCTSIEQVDAEVENIKMIAESVKSTDSVSAQKRKELGGSGEDKPKTLVEKLNIKL